MKPPAACIWSTRETTSFDGLLCMSLTFWSNRDFLTAISSLKRFAVAALSRIPPPPQRAGAPVGGRAAHDGLRVAGPGDYSRAPGSCHAQLCLFCGRRKVRALFGKDGGHRRGDRLLLLRGRQAEGGRRRFCPRRYEGKEGPRGGLHQPFARELPRTDGLRPRRGAPQGTRLLFHLQVPQDHL